MLFFYASEFGKELRCKNTKEVKFKGRKSRTASHQQSYANHYNIMQAFCHTSMQTADFYLGSDVKTSTIRSMFVLGDAEHARVISNCNDIQDYDFGELLYEYLLSLTIPASESRTAMAAGCYHMDSEMNHDQVTYFPGHLDKPFVHTAWFVPLGVSSFFTVLSISHKSGIIQDLDLLRYFHEWKGRLSSKDSSMLDEFLLDFDAQAKRFMHQDNLSRLIFWNRCGSVLSFPANQCYHATITPKKPIGYPRDLFVFHPLDGVS